MDNSNRQMNRNTDNLGINKMGKNIKKSPVHQPNLANSIRPPQQPPSHVYTIDKNDFRNVVQQLTGSPSHHQEQAGPRLHQNNPPRPSSMRLQKIRPPPLMSINRPYVPIQVPTPMQQQPQPQPQPPPMVPYNNNLIRPSPPIRPPFPGGDSWPNTAESPVSAYMRYLQNFIMDPASRPTNPQSQSQSQPQPYTQPPYGLVQNQPLPSPRYHGLAPIPSPRMNGPPPPPPFPSPRTNGAPTLLQSPTSQFLLPSPTGFMVSPRSSSSSYPWFSPGFQQPPPLTPNFSFSPMAQQAPPSPNYGFPLSPNGLFPIVSPRWRNQ